MSIIWITLGIIVYLNLGYLVAYYSWKVYYSDQLSELVRFILWPLATLEEELFSPISHFPAHVTLNKELYSPISAFTAQEKNSYLIITTILFGPRLAFNSLILIPAGIYYLVKGVVMLSVWPAKKLIKK